MPAKLDEHSLKSRFAGISTHERISIRLSDVRLSETKMTSRSDFHRQELNLNYYVPKDS
jgi:hypothetical protein